MYLTKPMFLWGEPFLDFQLKLDFKKGNYDFSLIVAHLSIFSFYRIGTWGAGFNILGFGASSL